MKRIITAMGLLAVLFAITSCNSSYKEISQEELRDKIAGAWLGQMVGNIYGLEYENKFVEQPGQGPFVFNKAIRKMTEVDGAFSDDDTDVEYLYLLMMEKYGVKPSYAQVREGWMYHIRDRVWLANRAALGLMHYGLTPPFTGDKRYNPHWFQIDPQLINEIWSYTAPGMPAYAAGLSEWAARITSDSWATSPTVVYGAMYSEAFFESDICKLVRNAKEYLPEDDRFRGIIDECLEMFEAEPDDWHPARARIAQEYYFDEPDETRTIWNADLNGAMGILALLYGGGDIDKTLEIGCSLGFDCDNQTATICGLLGVINGASSVPTDRSMPFEHCSKPFNDRYINVTRYDMPDASIEDIIDRTAVLAGQVIVANGGKVFERDGKVWYRINAKAGFKAPLEFCAGPEPRLEVGKSVNWDFRCTANSYAKWEITDGVLPEGLEFNDGVLSGTPVKAGESDITLTISDAGKFISRGCHLVVRGRNIAPEAAEILSLCREPNFEVIDSCWTTVSHAFYAKSVDVINDGVLDGPGASFYSLSDKSLGPRRDFFGYRWDEARTVDMVAFHYGCLEEFGGWYSNIGVEYLDADGKWQPLDAAVSPALPESDAVFIQPHFAEFCFSFEPVTTTAIRVIGDDCQLVHWHKYTKNVSSFISVTEVSVYEAS